MEEILATLPPFAPFAFVFSGLALIVLIIAIVFKREPVDPLANIRRLDALYKEPVDPLANIRRLDALYKARNEANSLGIDLFENSQLRGYQPNEHMRIVTVIPAGVFKESSNGVLGASVRRRKQRRSRKSKRV
jgi:hypothetical protein